MSVAASAVAASNSSNKGEKSKKFQSLNINNLYQGSASKPLQRSAPQKHGLQSLGKVPTARRAPANLPSLKSETTGNDPNVSLVPSGTGGWAGGGGGPGTLPASAASTGKAGGADAALAAAGDSAKPAASNDHQVEKKRSGEGAVIGIGIGNAPNSEKSWSSSNAGGVFHHKPAGSKPPQSFLNQRSPLFGQEFPSLGDGGVPAAAAVDSHAGSGAASAGSGPPMGGGSSAPSAASVAAGLSNSTGSSGAAAHDAKYGPGPNLRPQTSSSWIQGGGGGSGGKMTGPGAASRAGVTAAGGVGVGQGGFGGANLDGLGTPASDPFHKPPPSSTLPPPVMPQFDVSLKGPPGPTPQANFLKKGTSRISASSSVGMRGRQAYLQQQQQQQQQQQGAQVRELQPFKEHSIIDTEKLKRMDMMEGNDDDWTRSDDNFDYNKKLKRFVCTYLVHCYISTYCAIYVNGTQYVHGTLHAALRAILLGLTRKWLY